MRKLPFLLVLLLLSLLLLAAAASAHAARLPVPAQGAPLLGKADDDSAAADEGEADEGGEDEDCESEDDEEAESCEEAEDAEEAGGCVLEGGTASFTVVPGAGEVRLRIHYRAFEAGAVLVDASLHGAKGSLHLGSERARFHRSGVLRYSFQLGARQIARALAARGLEVKLRAVGAPADCELDL